MPSCKPRNLGSIYTPIEFARLSVEWGIRNRHDKVLDLGIGEGVFTFLAQQRLQKLGASTRLASAQLYGAEIHAETYETFTNLAEEKGLVFPNICQGDFLIQDFPKVQVALGNPPYVRRSAITDFEDLRNEISIYNTSLAETEVSRLADLYIYFLLNAASNLKVGGRLAVITADTWLNARYGEAFKKILIDNFNIESLISFDRAVFPDAQVKPVLLFATKTKATSMRRNVWFIRAQNGLAPIDLLPLVKRRSARLPDTSIKKLEVRSLEAANAWGEHFKSSDLVKEINSHPLMTKLQNQFKTRIGVQTLANDFFVLSTEQSLSLKIEMQFLMPLAHSSQDYKTPLIAANITATHFLFYCADKKSELISTCALKYIENAEEKIVPVRGKGTFVIGYQNKERIKQDKRPNWYDLRSSLEKRGLAPILIPRLFSRTFQVVWNQASFVASDSFIECNPTDEVKNDLELCLAILTNSLTELFIRNQSQLYGGGAHTVSPKRIKDIPILNLKLLTDSQKNLLRQAYQKYVATMPHDRSIIDRVLYKVLGIDLSTQNQIAQTLEDLVELATNAKVKTKTI